MTLQCDGVGIAGSPAFKFSIFRVKREVSQRVLKSKQLLLFHFNLYDSFGKSFLNFKKSKIIAPVSVLVRHKLESNLDHYFPY